MNEYVLSELNGEFIDLTLDKFEVNSASINYISVTRTNSISFKSVNVSVDFDVKCYNANSALAQKVFREKFHEKLQKLQFPEGSIKFITHNELNIFPGTFYAQTLKVIYMIHLLNRDLDLFKFYCDPYLRWSLTKHID